MNNHPNHDEQSWDVFRYVSCEMSPGEETYFEQLLAEDQNLREEVANMVLTMARADKAHLAVRSIPATANARGNRLRVRRLIVSAAALALLATLAITLTQQPDKARSNAESVAAAWAESINEEEFELPELEDDFEFASFEFEGDDDWIVDVVTAANEESSIN
ncbi:hypothetical protein [Mariniblastus fucicola]|nr:hypothetical protein [Mariniblastus fucicola]